MVFTLPVLKELQDSIADLHIQVQSVCAASFIKSTSYLRNGEVTCGDANPNRFQVRSRYPQVCKPGVELSEIAERE